MGHYPVQAVESLDEVELIGGIDISTSKKNQNFAVVAFGIFEYPSMKVSYTNSATVSRIGMRQYTNVNELRLPK